MSVEVKPQAKSFFKKIWFIYILVLHIVVIWQSDYITYSSDETGTILLVDFPFYSKTILIGK